MLFGYVERAADKEIKKLIDKLTDTLPRTVLVPVRGVMVNDTDMTERIQKVLTWMDEKGYDFITQSRGFNLTTLSFNKRDVPYQELPPEIIPPGTPRIRLSDENTTFCPKCTAWVKLKDQEVKSRVFKCKQCEAEVAFVVET